MIQYIEHYGPLGKPENKKEVDVDTDPLELIVSIYKQWIPIAHHITSKRKDVSYKSLYNEAANLLAPFADKMDGVDPIQLEDAISDLMPSDQSISCQFLSALLKESNIPSVAGIFFEADLGYGLPRSKKLIIKEGSKVYNLGENSDGEIVNYGEVGNFGQNSRGTLINFGTVLDMSIHSSQGLHINFGEVGFRAAESVIDGIFLNFGQIYCSFANSSGGIQINYGIVSDHDERTKYNLGFSAYGLGGFKINLGTVPNMAKYTEGGLQINYDTVLHQNTDGVIKLDFANIFSTKKYNSSIIEKVKPLILSLESKLREVEYLKDLKNKPDEAIKAINSKDWKKFEREIFDIKEEIEGLLK